MRYDSHKELSIYRLDERARATLSITRRLIERSKNLKQVILYKGDYEHIDRLLQRESSGRLKLSDVTFLGYPVAKG